MSESYRSMRPARSLETFCFEPLTRCHLVELRLMRQAGGGTLHWLQNVNEQTPHHTKRFPAGNTLTPSKPTTPRYEKTQDTPKLNIGLEQNCLQSKSIPTPTASLHPFPFLRETTCYIHITRALKSYLKTSMRLETLK